MKKFYITTPLYYVNASPHIGHSYTNIASDALARFWRLNGYDVLFVTGTDEHGQKIKEAAEKEGLEPEVFVDMVVPRFIGLWERLNISYDDFIRTTQERHIRVVQHVLEILYKKGDLYEGEYSGWYCTPCETFWQPSQIMKGFCPDCKRPVEHLSEKNYFFRLSKYQDWLMKYIESHPDFILPQFRRNEIQSFLKNKIFDLCISRPKSRLTWGIPIPFSESHVTYVWFDALINYISVAGFLDEPDKFKRYWPCDIHIIGKDILRQHAVYWPIILHAIGVEPPKTIFAHGWWRVGEEKMSKSKGNIIDPLQIIERYGVNAYRYFLLKEVPFGLDGSFTEEALVFRINSDLANDLGNLLNRTLVMVEKYFSGTIPVIDSVKNNVIKENIEMLLEKLQDSFRKIDFCEALFSIWELVNKANKLIEESAPWKLSKENRVNELKVFIYSLFEVLRITAISIYPFMPETAEEMWEQLGLGDIKRTKVEDIKWGLGSPGTKINRGKPLFPRIVG